MPVRLRITLLFTLLVFVILSIVCVGIYYFSYTSRINSINARLTNRAITTARLLSQREIFDFRLIQRIDSFTTITLKSGESTFHPAVTRRRPGLLRPRRAARPGQRAAAGAAQDEWERAVQVDYLIRSGMDRASMPLSRHDGTMTITTPHAITSSLTDAHGNPVSGSAEAVR